MIHSLESLLETYTLLRRIGECILLVGLAIELFVIAFLHGKNKAEQAGSLIGTVIIIIGVMMESFAGGRADDVVRRMRAPRSLSDRQRIALSETLKRFGRHEAVLFEISDVDPELAGITRDLSRALAGAGWKAEFDRWPPFPPMELRAPATGILLLISPLPSNKEILKAVTIMASMLRTDGLEAQISQAFIGPAPPPDNRLKIVVYAK